MDHLSQSPLAKVLKAFAEVQVGRCPDSLGYVTTSREIQADL
jgi:hypothetical protein